MGALPGAWKPLFFVLHLLPSHAICPESPTRKQSLPSPTRVGRKPEPGQLKLSASNPLGRARAALDESGLTPIPSIL